MKDCIAQLDIRPGQTERNIFRRPRKVTPSARYYGSSNLIKLTDEVGSEAGIFQASFKSKAWSKFTQAATRLTAKTLREKLDLSNNISITFSVYAGCSMCACSPGFVIRPKNDEGSKELRDKELVGTTIYGEMKFANHIVTNFKETKGTEFLNAFAAEEEQQKEQNEQ